MAGLNYGNRFKRYKPWSYKEGIFYVEQIDKWIVRVTIGATKRTTTISKHETEEEAQEAFDTYNGKQ